MERNSFKEYSVLAMVSKEEQRPMKACYNFFHLDRVIAWLDEVAKVAHNNTSRRLGKKKSQKYYLRAKLWMRTLIPSFPDVI